MPTGEETVKSLEDQYGKLLAIIMRKYKLRHVVINSDDINQAVIGGANLIVQELEDGLHVRVVGDAEAIKIQRTENKFNPPKR